MPKASAHPLTLSYWWSPVNHPLISLDWECFNWKHFWLVVALGWPGLGESHPTKALPWHTASANGRGDRTSHLLSYYCNVFHWAYEVFSSLRSFWNLNRHQKKKPFSFQIFSTSKHPASPWPNPLPPCLLKATAVSDFSFFIQMTIRNSVIYCLLYWLPKWVCPSIFLPSSWELLLDSFRTSLAPSNCPYSSHTPGLWPSW